MLNWFPHPWNLKIIDLQNNTQIRFRPKSKSNTRMDITLWLLKKLISYLPLEPYRKRTVTISASSTPRGNALNDFAINNKFQYQSLQNAIDYIQPEDFLAKIDIVQAYRVVKIHPSNYRASGLKFKLPGMDSYTYFYDTHLPFGAQKSLEIFNALSQAVRVIMSILSSFLMEEKCAEAMRTLISVLRCLGFWINYK